MALTFRCSTCLEQLFVPESMKGQQVRCGKCSSVLVVPVNAVPVADPQRPQPQPPAPPRPAAPAPAQPLPAQPLPAQPLPAQPLPAALANEPRGSRVLGLFTGIFVVGGLFALVCGGLGAWLIVQYNNAERELADGVKDTQKRVLAGQDGGKELDQDRKETEPADKGSEVKDTKDTG